MGVDLADPAVLAPHARRHGRGAARATSTTVARGRRRPTRRATGCGADPARADRPAGPARGRRRARRRHRAAAARGAARAGRPTDGGALALRCSTARVDAAGRRREALKAVAGRRAVHARPSCPGSTPAEQLRAGRAGCCARACVVPGADRPAAGIRGPQPRETAGAVRAARPAARRPDARHRVPGRPAAAGRAARARGARRAARLALRPGVAAALERRADAAGVRVLAIRRPGRTPRTASAALGARRLPRRVASRCGRGTFGDDAELLDLPLDGSRRRRPTTAPLLPGLHARQARRLLRAARPAGRRGARARARAGSGSAATSAATGSPRTSGAAARAAVRPGAAVRGRGVRRRGRGRRGGRRVAARPGRPAAGRPRRRWPSPTSTWRCARARRAARASRRRRSRTALATVRLAGPHGDARRRRCAVETRAPPTG